MPPRRSVPPRIVVPDLTQPPPPPLEAEAPEDGADDFEQEVGDLAALSEATYADWSWYVYRIRGAAELARDPLAKPRVLVTRLSGAVDILDFQSRFGGGLFEFWGWGDTGDGRGRRLRTKQRHEIEGPRKQYPLESPALAPPAPAAAASGVNGEQLGQLQRMIERLEARVSAAPAGQALTISDVLKLLPLLSRSEPQLNPGEMMKEMVGAFKMGAETTRGAEAGEKGALEVVLERLGPAIERVATAMVTRRPALRSGPSAGGVPRGAATPEPEAEPAVSHRWMTAVESLAEAVSEGDDPQDFAITLERILPAGDLNMLRLNGTDQVMAEITGAAGERFPVLKTADARAFVEAVLAELRAPLEDGSSPS